MVSRRLLDAIRNPSVLHCLLILLAICAVFWKVTGFDFVSWDDTIHVYQNRYFENINSHNLIRFWIHPYYSLYIPVAYMAFAALSLIDRSQHPRPQITEFNTCLNPHVFHDASLILHVINAILVYFLIHKLVKSQLSAVFGALLFALHPLQVESVAWISELRGLLSTAFALSGVLVYLSVDRPNRRYSPLDIIALLLFLAALLTKPAIVVLPVILLVWETLFLGAKWRDAVQRLSPWFFLAFVAVLVTHAVQSVATVMVHPVLQRCVIAVDTYGFYIQKVFWPVNLATDYGRTPGRVLSGHLVLASLPFVLGLMAVAIIFRKKQSWLLPSIMTFFLFILPVSGLVPFAYQYYSSVADRYMYLAMLGPSISLAFCLSKISLPRDRTLICVLATFVLCLLSLRTINQTSTWRNSAALFTNALVVDPGNWLSHDQLGNFYLRHRQWPAAEQEFKFVTANGPVDSSFWWKLGNAVQGEGRLAEAIADYSHALALTHNLPLALYARAQCEALAAEPSSSIADFQAATHFLGASTDIDYELAMELGSVGRYNEAAAEFARAVQEQPTKLDAYYYLAMTYTKLGEPRLASDVAKMALARDPNDAKMFPYVSLASS